MYTNDSTCVGLGDKMTDYFQTNQGVRQGCVLSPILFNIFLADITNNLKGNEDTYLRVNEGDPISSIIWADDLLLLSDSEKGLNNVLVKLEDYCKQNEIEVNLEKTKCMIFNKTGRLLRRSFWFGNKRLENVREYKYLGFLITPSLNLNSSLKDLKDRAMRAFYTLKSKMGDQFKRDIITSLHLFDSLIKPILLYGSDYWGCLKLPKNNPIETLHMTFCKELLGVQKQTTNIGVLLELGRVPLSIYAKKNCVKNWERIAIRKDANFLSKASYEFSLYNNTGWAQSIKDYLSQIGLMNVFLNENVTRQANLEASEREKDMFYQTSFLTIQQNTSKLRLFGKLKKTIGLENYLINTKNTTDRISMTKIRLSNHGLMIEKGRHNHIERENRKCPFCKHRVEDEFHFIIECPTYASIRAQFLEKLNLRDNYYNNQSLFTLLMETENIIPLTAKYITRATTLREFILTKHRNVS